MSIHSSWRFEKNFRYYEGNLHLVASEILARLGLQPTEYSPVLQKNYQGNFTYKQVEEYSSMWLKKTKEGLQKDQRYYEPFEPSQVWTQYRWIFVRRMAGYELCQKGILSDEHVYLVRQWYWAGFRTKEVSRYSD